MNVCTFLKIIHFIKVLGRNLHYFPKIHTLPLCYAAGPRSGRGWILTLDLKLLPDVVSVEPHLLGWLGEHLPDQI